ncbi:MAG: hypothetical protein KAI63_03970 [Planctomycetes bacterium]|nr:hypothetical protein [Planctomycetota bacterium]
MQCPGQDKAFWKPEDIFEVKCPKCQAMVEFWKDDVFRRCKKCQHRFRNPKLDLGCAEWCKFAKYCLGQDVQSIPEDIECKVEQDKKPKEKESAEGGPDDGGGEG